MVWFVVHVDALVSAFRADHLEGTTPACRPSFRRLVVQRLELVSSTVALGYIKAVFRIQMYQGKVKIVKIMHSGRRSALEKTLQ